MKPKTFFVLLCLAMLAQHAAAVGPTISNVRAAQRAGTQLVDVYYDLASASNTLIVYVQVSTNGGASFTLPATSFTGAVGGGIAPGTNQKITWNAGQDWPTNFSTNVRFRVTADDQVAPSGMALIPAGSFTMGNCMNSSEGNSNELPLHTVYVSAFYMDKYDVTKSLWDSVYQWATNHGYSFDYAGSGKAANHPVQTIDWYDAVKWCNARSEKEGKIPAYYTTSAQTVVYRSGQTNVQNDWVKWSSGYRLPTEAEWEKAARGGASGQRFPWGNTISESQANYYSSGTSYYTYDLSNTGYNPTFNGGVYPFTSPVGYFAPNGYGLYDMAGNVWQWCWDWYGDYGANMFYYIRNDVTGLSWFGTIDPLTGILTDRFNVPSNLHGLMYADQNENWGPTLFYATHHPASGADNFDTISTISAPAYAGSQYVGFVTNEYNLTLSGYDALTLAAPDVGYGAVNFYYLRHDNTGVAHFGVIKGAPSDSDLYAHLPGTGYTGLAFAAANVGGGMGPICSIMSAMTRLVFRGSGPSIPLPVWSPRIATPSAPTLTRWFLCLAPCQPGEPLSSPISAMTIPGPSSGPLIP